MGNYASGQMGKWASGRVGEWASGRVGEWARSGRVGGWAGGRVSELAGRKLANRLVRWWRPALTSDRLRIRPRWHVGRGHLRVYVASARGSGHCPLLAHARGGNVRSRTRGLAHRRARGGHARVPEI